MNKKQTIFVLITAGILISLFGYSMITSIQKEKDDEGKLDIIVTFYPLEYFTRVIGGEHVSVDVLVPYNSEIHAWQPSTSQILAADEADIIIYNGAGVDHWFEEDILPAIRKSNKQIVESAEGIQLREMEDEDDHGDEGDGGGDDHEHGMYDPHTWISPVVAKQQAENIYSALVSEDPSNEPDYTANWKNLSMRFEEMDREYRSSLSNRTRGEIITSHAAFGYLADEYGFEQHGVIGLSADEQPSTATIAELVELMADEDNFVVYVDPVYSDDFAETIKTEVERETGENVKILKLYFMLGPKDGLDYFEQMQKNLDNLKIGLGAQ